MSRRLEAIKAAREALIELVKIAELAGLAGPFSAPAETCYRGKRPAELAAKVHDALDELAYGGRAAKAGDVVLIRCTDPLYSDGTKAILAQLKAIEAETGVRFALFSAGMELLEVREDEPVEDEPALERCADYAGLSRFCTSLAAVVGCEGRSGRCERT